MDQHVWNSPHLYRIPLCLKQQEREGKVRLFAVSLIRRKGLLFNTVNKPLHLIGGTYLKMIKVLDSSKRDGKYSIRSQSVREGTHNTEWSYDYGHIICKGNLNICIIFYKMITCFDRN